MEIVLATVVVITVIFFGALISMGNERQRKAIDNLREQTVLWAIQDLRIKRERLARDVRVDDPLGWLNRIAAKVCGYDLNLQVVEAFDGPRALMCTSGNGDKVLFSPLSPAEIRQFSSERHNQLSQYGERNPLLSLTSHPRVYELSALNTGFLFDLELSLAWKELTGQQIEGPERLRMYVI